MGHLEEFPRTVRLFLQGYRWRRIHPVPWTPLDRPLSDCRVALVSSAGLVAPGQEPFDHEKRGGDYSYRVLPSSVDVRELVECHRSHSFDRTGLEVDKGLALPVERLKELAGNGRIGSVSPKHLSFMGSITAPGRLIKETAPRAAEVLRGAEVDVALLVPV